MGMRRFNARRDFLWLAAAWAGSVVPSGASPRRSREAGATPPPAKIRAVLDAALRRTPESFNTDWFGTVMRS